MPKQLNVNLGFSADTSQAQQKINELKASLNAISSIQPSFGMNLTKDMQSAVSSAKTLQTHLSNALNVNTGALDLSKLNASLKSAGTDLGTLSANLLKAGTSGEQAFMNIQRSVASASVQMKQANGLLANFWTTLKNTARWQFSSSMLHGFIGAVQSAYGYAQDLDKSLNNIRIVTGYNTDAMAKFAEQANKAAKALSTTTTTYTDASLIFYQQGLSGDAVTERADTVIKLSNVTGEAAKDVSNYMTAIWNNFDNGSKSLEYYADVLTKLGATTASSTDEIAAGLEKFAAIAGEVGLSYEYATAALATVTAETRQSADVVGTAFKTIFARIQGLTLGETLEDGVDLNKYSQALAKVGVDVLDTNGQLKQMDTILRDMAGVWDDISEAQRVALAQAVGGVRQYNQVMALMKDWDVMELNLANIDIASGTLQEQQETYEESWAAASKRVKASLEGIYNDLIPTDFIVSMTSAFADVLEGVDALINGFGGLQGILLLVANIALTKLGPSIANGINQGVNKITEFATKIPSMLNLGLSFRGATTGSQELVTNLAKVNSVLNTATAQSDYFAKNFAKSASESLKTGQNLNVRAMETAAKESIVLSNSFEQYLADTGKVYNIQGLIEQNAAKLTAAEKERLKTMQQQTLELAAQKAEAQAVLEAAQRASERSQMHVGESIFTNSGYQDSYNASQPLTGFTSIKESTKPVDDVMSSMTTKLSAANEQTVSLAQNWNAVVKSFVDTDTTVSQIGDKIAFTSSQTNGVGKAASGAASAYGNIVSVNEKINRILNQQGVSLAEKKKAIRGIINEEKSHGRMTEDQVKSYRAGVTALKDTEKSMGKLTAAMNQTQGQARQMAMAYGNSEEHLNQVRNGVYAVNDAEIQLSDKQREFNAQLEQTIAYLTQAGARASSLGGMIATGLQGFSTIAMGINSVSNAIKTLGDDSAGFGQKLTALAMGLTMGFSALKTVIAGVGGSITILSNGKKALAASTGLVTAAQKAENLEDLKGIKNDTAQLLLGELMGANRKEEIAQILTGIGVKNAEAVAEQMVAMAKEKNFLGAMKLAASNVALAASEYMVLWPLLLIVAAVAAVVAAFAIWDACTVSAAEKTERLTENVENMKDAAAEAKEEAEGLKDAYEEYQGLVKTLEACTVGTTEWKEAMEGVRDAIDSILEAYPDLAKIQDLLVWDEDTQSYVLDPNKMEDYIQQSEESADALSYGSQMASGMLAKNRADNTKTDFENAAWGTTAYGYNSTSGMSSIDVENDLTGDRDTDEKIIKDAIRADVLAAGYIDKYQYAKTDNYGNYLYDQNTGELLYDEDKFNAAVDAWVEGQQYIVDELLGIAETYHNVNNEANTIFDNATKAYVSDKFAGQGLTEAEMNAAAAATQKDYDSIFEDLYGTDGTDGSMADAFAKGDSDWNSLSDEGQAILTRYEKAMGGTPIDWADNLVQGTDANRTFHINGQDDPLTPEEIATTIAAYEALGGENATENQQESMNTVSGALASANDTGDALISAITNGGDKEAMSNFLSTMTQEQINTLLGGIDENGNISEEVLKSMGLTPDQLAEVGEVFGLGAQEIGTALLDAGSTIANFTEEQQAVLDSTAVDMSDATVGEQKAFADARTNTGTHLSESSDGAITDSVLGDIESQNADNVEGLTKFYEGLGEIDLTAEDAGERIAALAEQYGIEGEAIDGLITSVEGLDQVYSIATSNISEQAASLKSIVGEGLSAGDTVSAEDLQVLEAAGVNVDQYFTQMADGTYALTGKADEFNDAVNRITFEGLKKQWNDFSAAQTQATTGTSTFVQENLTNTAVVNGDSSVDSSDLGRGRLDYINSFEAGTFDFSEEQTQLLADYTANPEMELTAEQLQMIADMIGVVNNKASELEGQMFSTATSVAELNQIAAEMGSYSLNAYGEALIGLASKYDNCSQEIEDMQAALMSGDEAMIRAATDALELATTIGELSEKYGLDAKDVETHAKLLKDSAEGYELTAEQAANLAVANRRMNKGVKTLNENWKDWSKILKSSDRTTADYADTLNDAHEALADLVGAVDAGSIPLDFLDASTESGAEHLEWMARAAEGDAQAINLLGSALAIAQVKAMEVAPAMKQAYADAFNIDPGEVESRFLAAQTAVTNAMQQIHDAIAAGLSTEEINAKINAMGTDWVDGLNEMALATGMSVEQMNAMLNEMGVQAEVEVKDVPQKMKIQGYAEQVHQTGWYDQEYFDYTTNETKSRRMPLYSKYTVPGPTKEIDGVVQVAQIKTEGSSLESPAVTYTGTSGGSVGGGISPSSTSGGSSGGGGGSTPKKTSDSRKKRSEMVDPYKEVNDQLERTNHLMSKNSTIAEGLWGAARFSKMRENINLLKQEVGLLDQKLAIAETEMNLARQDLTGAAAVLGVTLDIDSDDTVANIVDVEEAIWAKREALLDSFGGEMDEAEQAQLEAFDEYVENFTNAYDNYENHRTTLMQTEEERVAKVLEAQEALFDELNTLLERNVSLIENDLELIEYYLSKVEDDFYGMAEAAALMVGSLSSANPGEGGQLGGYLDILAEQKRHKEELDAAYAAGDINQTQYLEGMMECQSAIIEQLQNLNELDRTMKEYYGETLEAAQDELSQYTDMMEHHSEVLEHYSNLLELIGASKDWERMKTVLEAQVSVAENAAAVSKANYELLAQEAADKKAAWDALGKGLGDELTYEESVIKQQWLDAQAAADEAQNQMLDDAAAWAESLKALLETELAELADILNESLSGEFGSLDNMMTAMERANSLQEEYLTTTNQVYETNKLMHTAQQEIDKTTNSVAKRRLKQYIDETEQLQNKNKLSQFELDIQKAKYDLLVAEIALEEAQQAKSTVRLQRDSEGNFGYVYTADQNAVAEAEQQLADAQNALYNIGLEGANKYAESYAQTIQEMNDAVTELTEQWQNGEISSKEEYQQRMLELEEYYGEKLMQYSELHSIALQTDSRIAAEAWTKDFAYMTTQTQRWMTNVDVYVQGVEASMDRYQQGIDRVEQYAGLDLDSLKEKTSNIKDENKALAKSITEKDGLLDAIKDEITQVNNLTREYSALRTEIQGTVDDYEALLRRMGVEIDTAASNNPPLGGGEEDPGTTDPGTTDPGTTDPGTTDPGTTDPGAGGKTISVGGKINAGGAQIYDYAGDTSGERQYFRNDPIYQVLKDQGDWIQVRHHKLSSGITGWFKKSDVAAMNTGGYTGDWAGSYGKLAFLHQKELVLNAQDTENLLASMDILNKIISTIDLYSSSAQLGGLLSSPRYSGFDSEPLEQNVHIEASFPSVTDHNEIEDALNNLINRASQYAHRK